MRLAIMVVCATACGGGSDGSPGGSSCVFSAELSGAVTASFDGSQPTCQGALDLGGDPIVVFFPDDDAIMRLDIETTADQIGVLGPIAGSFSVISNSGLVWESNDCTLDISQWNAEGTRMAGTGTCAGPLEPESGSDAITVGTFELDMF